MATDISFKLNGKPVTVNTDGQRPLLWVLRTDLGLTGTKFGCGKAQCSACTVLVNNNAVYSCIYPVKNVAGKKVRTIEGLSQDGKLHPVQKAFMKHDALQCGYCTPGMILRACGFLLKNPNPTRAEIVEGMERNLCRCGAHQRIIQAVEAAAKEMKEGASK
jgi:aerobic-type carbon monoxide dehydrogenase small subunit (CoxS/CutS family)